MRVSLSCVGKAAVLLGMLWMGMTTPAAAASVNGSQARAAEEFIGAVASGSAKSIAQSIHPAELELLRKRVLDLMRLEADRGENGVRTRLFGPAMPLADLERLTPENFYVALSRRIALSGRNYEDISWLQAIEDKGSMVHVVGRGKPLKDHGDVRTVVLVTLVPWGKDWKAAIPLEVQAQLDDLIAARGAGGEVPRTAGAGEPAVNNLQPIVQLLDDAEKALVAGDCDQYYDRYMSPNFRRLTAAKALRTLITTCNGKTEVRETLIAALRAAKAGKPRYEYDATRAIYDLRGAGLPFERYTLELVNKRWYVAE